MSGTEIARALAPAKVNLQLEVLGRRPDGYHEIDTALVALALCDQLEARRDVTGGISLAVSGPHAAGVPADERNLAWRAAVGVLAAARAAEAVGADAGIALALEKRIPSESGLGGGSSDAAAALLASERVLDFELERDARRRLLARLGSDCVFFLEAAATGSARCRGRGEVVEPRARVLQSWSIALVVPDVRASTAAVYEALSKSLSPPVAARSVRDASLELDEPAARASLANRLESAALAAFPELRIWRALLDESGASHFRMSGSGSSFFGLYLDPARAARDLAAIETRARTRGRRPRGSWTLALAGHGAQLVDRS